MDRPLLVSLATAALGLVLLGTLATVHAAHPVAIEELPRLAGQRVCLEGELVHARTTPSGSTRLVLAQTHASVPAWAPFQPAAVPGDAVLLCGEVATNGIGPEMRLEFPGDLQVTRRWDESEASLDAIVEHPWDYNGRHVVVRAQVACERNTCWIQDGTTNARLPFSGDPTAPSVEPLRGIIEYESEKARFRFVREP